MPNLLDIRRPHRHLESPRTAVLNSPRRPLSKLKPFQETLLAVILFALVAVAINSRVLRYGIIFESHDLHAHIKWLQQFSYHLLREGTFYPRWLAGLNHGYGSPTFVFYPPAVMYLGSMLKAIGLDAASTIAALMVLMSFTAGLGVYLFGRLRWRFAAALGGALAYMLAPYMVYNAYHRGALAEVLAASLLPFGLFFTDNLIRHRQHWLALTLCFSLLSLTHLPSLLLYGIAWSAYVVAQRLSFKHMAYIVTAPMIGFGLSSFYLVPAILEKKLVNLDSMRTVAGGFAAHLVPLVGNPHHLTGNVITIFRYGVVSTVIYLGVAVALNHTLMKQGWLWLMSLVTVSFFISAVSYPVWAASPTLQMVQFPWRLMGLFSLIYAGALGFAIESLMAIWPQQKITFKLAWPRLVAALAAAGILLCLLGWNVKYAHNLTTRHAGLYAPGDLTEARTAKLWKARSFDVIAIALHDPYSNRLGDVAEYLPMLPNGVVVPRPLQNQPETRVISGRASVSIDQWKGDERRLLVTASQPTELQVRTYNYPAWRAYVDGKAIPIKTLPEGLIGLSISSGDHTVELRYQATNAMKLGGTISLLSLLYVLVRMTLSKISTKRSISA